MNNINASLVHGQKLCICKKSGRIYVINLHDGENFNSNKRKTTTCAHISSLKRVCPL